MKFLLLVTLSMALLGSCALTKSSSKRTTRVKTQNIKESNNSGMEAQKATVKNKVTTNYKEGEYRDFKLMNSKNSFRSLEKILKESKENFTVLTFSSQDCTSCKESRAKLKELSTKLNFNLVHIISNVGSKDTKTFINKTKEIASSENLKEALLDSKSLTAKLYSVDNSSGLTCFVINKNNKKMSSKINAQVDKLENLIKQNLK